MTITQKPTLDHPGRLMGVVGRVHFSSETFSAGQIETDGRLFKFKADFAVSTGEFVTMLGEWVNDPKWGMQFHAKGIDYELPEDATGLAIYLAKHSDFNGIGKTVARKIANVVHSASRLETILARDIKDVVARFKGQRIPRKALERLKEAWGQRTDNKDRVFLASIGCTPNQSDKLIDRYGDAVVGVISENPYVVIREIDGFGFKRADAMAEKLGISKTDPHRIQAGVMFAFEQEVLSGHTWTGRNQLVDLAAEVLELEATDEIGVAVDALLETNQLKADGGRLSLPWLHRYERMILRAMKDHGWKDRTIGVGSVDLEGLKDKQIEAMKAALRHPVVIISGAAGTGKTFVLARLAKAFREAGLEIDLTSPTGKAAKRIEQSMRREGLELEAMTLHRLLKYDGRRFNAESVDADVLVVDEISMADTELMGELIQRMDLGKTRLILVGDHNQLPPVGPGSVLRDAIRHNLCPCVILDEVVRQAGPLKRNSTRILEGVVVEQDDAGWTVISENDVEVLQARVIELALSHDAQVLTPVHNGPLGTRWLNKTMQERLRGHVQQKFAVGDRVIQTRNDYDLEVMNGTIGNVLDCRGQGVYTILFEGRSDPIEVDADQSRDVELAYALSVHKAQGSEFSRVVAIAHRSMWFCDRALLYTAATRSHEHLFLVGDRQGLWRAVKSDKATRRRTLLDAWGANDRQIDLQMVEPTLEQAWEQA